MYNHNEIVELINNRTYEIIKIIENERIERERKMREEREKEERLMNELLNEIIDLNNCNEIKF